VSARPARAAGRTRLRLDLRAAAGYRRAEQHELPAAMRDLVGQPHGLIRFDAQRRVMHQQIHEAPLDPADLRARQQRGAFAAARGETQPRCIVVGVAQRHDPHRAGRMRDRPRGRILRIEPFRQARRPRCDPHRPGAEAELQRAVRVEPEVAHQRLGRRAGRARRDPLDHERRGGARRRPRQRECERRRRTQACGAHRHCALACRRRSSTATGGASSTWIWLRLMSGG
jgi:hypothetical protein